MKRVAYVLAAVSVACIMLTVAGCKTKQDYADERAEKAALHFQKAKYRELSGETLTLQKCIDEALKNSLQARISEMEIKVEKEMQLAEALGMLPQININNDFTARSNTPASGSEKLVATGETYGASYSEERAINYFNIDFMFSVLDFGLAFFNSRQQYDRMLLARQRKERAIQNLVFDVARAYFRVAAAQKVANLTSSALEQCRTRYEQVYQLSQKRLITPSRAFYESRRFSDMEKKLTAYNRNYENACVELRTLMGYYPNAAITVDESELDKALPALTTDPGLLEQIAVYQRPELYETDIQKHINILECRKIILMMIPSVKLYADWTNSSNKFLYHQSWWELGIRAAYDLLQLPQQIARLKSYDSQVDAETKRAYAQGVAVMAQVRIAHGNLDSAKERYDLNKTICNTYDEHLQAVLKNRALSGAVAQLDIDHMRLATTQANVERILSYSEYRIAYYRLMNVLGLKSVLDSRSAEEFDEELRLAEDTIRDEIKQKQDAFAKVLEAERQARIAEAKKLEANKKKAKENDRRAKARKAIEAKIKSESASSARN